MDIEKINFRVFMPIGADIGTVEYAGGHALSVDGRYMALAAPRSHENVTKCRVFDVLSDGIGPVSPKFYAFEEGDIERLDEVVVVRDDAPVGFITALRGEYKLPEIISGRLREHGDVRVFSARYPVVNGFNKRQDSTMLLLSGHGYREWLAMEEALMKKLQEQFDGDFAFSVEHLLDYQPKA